MLKIIEKVKENEKLASEQAPPKKVKKEKNKKVNLDKNKEAKELASKKMPTPENKIKKIKKEITLICLAGYMKILSCSFIEKFNGKIINIHPSLLPKYKGLDTHKRVLRNKEKFSGCTIHYVTSRLDSGKIILQKKVKIKKNDTIKSLKLNILKQEHKLYPKAIRKIFG